MQRRFRPSAPGLGTGPATWYVLHPWAASTGYVTASLAYETGVNTVLDAGGEPVAEGSVGDDGVDLERGIYRVVVGSIPPVRFDAVEVAGEDEVTLTLPPR